MPVRAKPSRQPPIRNRKPYFRKRGTYGAPLSKKQQEQVKKLIVKRLDMKCHYPTSALWVPATTLPNLLTPFAAPYDLTAIERYDNALSTDKDKCRLGDTIKIHRIWMSGTVSETASTNVWRMMVVRWANNDFADIDQNSIIQYNATNGAPLSMLKHNSPYQVLWDSGAQTIGTGSGLNPIQVFNVDLKFKNPLTTAYDQATVAATFSDIQKGLIRVYACCTTGSTCTVRYNWKTYFTDV